MEHIFVHIKLDFCAGDSLQTVYAHQGDRDTGKVIAAELYNNGRRVTLDSETDTITLFAAVGNTATAIGRSCYISNNCAMITITQELSALAGTQHCFIRVESENGVVHTASFDILVSADPTAGKPEVIATADIATRLTAAENDITVLEAADTIAEQTIANMNKLTIPGAIHSAFPEIANRYASFVVSETATLSQSSPYVDIAASTFDYAVDGVIVTTNSKILPPAGRYYETVGSNTRVHFLNASQQYGADDTLYFTIYSKTYVKSSGVAEIYPCTEQQYEDIQTPDPNTMYVITGVDEITGGTV